MDQTRTRSDPSQEKGAHGDHVLWTAYTQQGSPSDTGAFGENTRGMSKVSSVGFIYPRLAMKATPQQSCSWQCCITTSKAWTFLLQRICNSGSLLRTPQRGWLLLLPAEVELRRLQNGLGFFFFPGCHGSTVSSENKPRGTRACPLCSCSLTFSIYRGSRGSVAVSSFIIGHR